MGQFVADHCSDRAHVDGVIQLVVVERRLEDSGRKIDVVLLRIVVTRLTVGVVMLNSPRSTGFPIFARSRIYSTSLNRVVFSNKVSRPIATAS